MLGTHLLVMLLLNDHKAQLYNQYKQFLQALNMVLEQFIHESKENMQFITLRQWES